VRKALNDNPVAQIAVLGVLAVVVGFLLLTRVGSQGGDSGDTSATASDASATPAPAIDSAVTSAPSAVTDTAAPPTSSAEAPAGATVPAGAADAVGKFVAGPGLPESVVKAYKDDKTVVLLVLKHEGIDDDQLKRNVDRLRGKSDVALFVTNAGNISRYARITHGVDVDRVPALIVLRPEHLTKGTPRAFLSYGFRGPESVDQAVRDALYKGPRNLPSHPK
jgi:hypothetical protein